MERSLAGRNFNDVLVSNTRDGIAVQPLYTRQNYTTRMSTGSSVGLAAARGMADRQRAARGWDIRQYHRGDDLDAARKSILEDLNNGVTSVELDAPDANDIGRMLEGVPIDRVAVALTPHCDLLRLKALADLTAAAGRRWGLAPGSLLGFDPLGEWARKGTLVDSAKSTEIVEIVVKRSGNPAPKPAAASAAGPTLGPGVRAFTVDATRYCDAGATEAQWLAWATATGIEYLRLLVGAGLTVDSAADLIAFRLPATADEFMTIAALRAARVMWARAVTASGSTPGPAVQYQHAVTAELMYSRSDPWVNLLRATTAAFAAGVGNANAVTVLPFDRLRPDLMSGERPFGRQNGSALGRRLARNTQLVLVEESHLARSADPAGGSYYVEALTSSLANKAWQIMQQVEACGGMGTALGDGTIGRSVDASWSTREAGLRTRDEVVTGVSDFPLLTEHLTARQTGDRLPASKIVSHVPLIRQGAYGGRVAKGLPVRRLSEPFETLRNAADRHRAATGEHPCVWLAALGSLASHSRRTTWARNLLAAGGVEARGGDGDGFESPVAAAAAFRAAGVAVAVICGSNDVYARRATSTARALRDAGASFVALVGDPKKLSAGSGPDLGSGSSAGRGAEPGFGHGIDRGSELIPNLPALLREVGVDEFWHLGVDVVDLLTRLHRILGVSD